MIEEDTSPVSESPLASAANTALKHLCEVIRLGNLDAEARLVSIDDDVINLETTGADSGLLIGRKGQTLDALQYLLLVMVSQGDGPVSRFRLLLDADGYRKRRTEALEDLALSLAAQVRETGEEAVLEPLNPLERRIVHTALQNDEAVETYSEGEGADRHIVITPRKSL